MKFPIAVSLAACSGPLAAQTLVLPDNHNFMEAPSYGANIGDSHHWAATASRFQIVYEASHFTGKAGVQPGGVTITRLKFRGEDGEANLGGQVWTNVMVRLGSTSLTAATLTSSFAVNLAPGTTTSGPLGTIASVTVAPSIGSCPNQWCIDLDLASAGAAFAYDPHDVARPNLIVDITCPTAPAQSVPQFLLPMQDTTAHGAGIRGRSVWTDTPANANGILDPTPPVVGLGFVGSGGWPGEVPARAEYIGGGCGGAHATIYQAFAQDQPFDLQAGLAFLPDVYPNPANYTVVNLSLPIDASRLNAAPDSTDDDAIVAHPLQFQVQPFTYPGGGSTTAISASTNGVVWLDQATASTTWQPTKNDLLGTLANLGARFMPFWTDLNVSRNTGMGPLVGLHVTTAPESSPGAGDAVCYVTWHHVGAYRVDIGDANVYGHEVFDFQVAIHEQSGVVEFRYGTMPSHVSTVWADTMENAAIIGFTRGRISTSPVVPSLDPQSRDLSHELPFTTSVEGATSNVSLSAVATPVAGSALQTGRMFGGQSLRWNVANIPAGTILAFLNLDLGASQPGLQFPAGFGITAPGCMLSTTVNPLILGWEQWVLPGPSVIGANALSVPHGWEGAVITAQAIGLDVFGGPYLVPWASNTIRYTVGLD